jgi:hypothetical protein
MLAKLKRKLAAGIKLGIRLVSHWGWSVARFIRRTIVRTVVLPLVYKPRLIAAGDMIQDRKRPCFLLFRYKYYAGEERLGLSPEEHATFAPLKAADIADIEEYYLDLDYGSGIMAEEKLINVVVEKQPDLIVLSSYDPYRRSHPFLEVLQAIRSHCSIPTILIWHDSIGQAAVDLGHKLNPAVDLYVEQSAQNIMRHFAEKSIRLWVPMDSSLFHPGDDERDLAVSFVGSTGAYRDLRRGYLDMLRKNGIDLFQAGGQFEKFLVLEEYAAIFRRSKISLNFSESLPGWYQEKARVYEVIFSGALLMESDNEETRLHFTPMVDYVTFDGEVDLLDKVRYFLEHEEERREIAYSGYCKAVEKFNHDEFWGQTMEKLAELDIYHIKTH